MSDQFHELPLDEQEAIRINMAEPTNELESTRKSIAILKKRIEELETKKFQLEVKQGDMRDEIEPNDEIIGEEAMTYTLDEAGRKRLLTFIDEKERPRQEYHCYGKVQEKDENNSCHIVSEGRQWDAPDDRQALYERLMEKGMWHDFWEFALKIYREHNHGVVFGEHFSYWLLVPNPELACWLVNEFLKEEEDGKKSPV